MTLLMFEQRDSHAVIVTDSIAVSDTHQPTMQSKVRTAHHLNLATVAMGSSNLMTAWYHYLLTEPTIRDITDVNEKAPEVLSALQHDISQHLGDLGKSRVFVFGFTRGSDKLVRYRYESTDGFQPERHQGVDAFMSPPPPGFNTKTDPWPSTPQQYVELAERARNSGRVAIGGELFGTLIADGRIETVRWHRFPDYDTLTCPA